MEKACNAHKGCVFEITSEPEHYYVLGKGYPEAATRQLPAFAGACTLQVW
jgi:hypothetical protein